MRYGSILTEQRSHKSLALGDLLWFVEKRRELTFGGKIFTDLPDIVVVFKGFFTCQHNLAFGGYYNKYRICKQTLFSNG